MISRRRSAERKRHTFRVGQTDGTFPAAQKPTFATLLDPREFQTVIISSKLIEIRFEVFRRFAEKFALECDPSRKGRARFSSVLRFQIYHHQRVRRGKASTARRERHAKRPLLFRTRSGLVSLDRFEKTRVERHDRNVSSFDASSSSSSLRRSFPRSPPPNGITTIAARNFDSLSLSSRRNHQRGSFRCAPGNWIATAITRFRLAIRTSRMSAVRRASAYQLTTAVVRLQRYIAAHRSIVTHHRGHRRGLACSRRHQCQ